VALENIFILINGKLKDGVGQSVYRLSYGLDDPGSILKRERNIFSLPERCVELYLHSPTMSSWCGVYLNTGTTLPFIFYMG
jgi:hypothetical protein